MTKIWKMGISPDNFISDTQDLTNEELGVYFRLLCYAWKKEAYLPKDHERLKRIGQGCNDKSISYLLETFFIEDERGYYCKAQKEEFDWVVEKSGKATESANRRWNKTQSESTSERNANHSHSYNHNKIIKLKEKQFEELWSKLKVKRGSKSEALKFFIKLFKKKDMPETEFIIKKFNDKCDSVTEKIFIPHFSTWLNKEMWTEELITENKTSNDNFGIVIRDPYRNLTFWKKGRRMPQDFDEDIIKKYKEGEISDEAMEKLNITV